MLHLALPKLYSLVILSVLLISSGIASLTTQRVFAPTIKTLRSSEAGYKIDYTNMTSLNVEGILGFWTVPIIRVPNASDVSLVFESLTVGFGADYISIGTSQFAESNGTVKYRAFYANLPENTSQSPVRITDLNGMVGPGTRIGAQILKIASDTWEIDMITPQTSFSLNLVHASSLHVAQWLVQSLTDGSVPLANFNFVSFDHANATINGVSTRLNLLDNERLRLFDQSNNCNLADTESITASGDSFTVDFVRAAPPCPVPQALPQVQTQNQTKPPQIINDSLTILLAAGGFLVAGVVITILSAALISARRKNIPSESTTPALTSMNALCKKCSSTLKPNARFCDNCGQAVL
ncbi:hypothetical protein E6H23_00070 [Candidatus Bathyarchaeota archaeon]|nr:MAG: hypothetical protein E6H23_00070 [Candidatus Bathyarchaeota archaeon]